MPQPGPQVIQRRTVNTDHERLNPTRHACIIPGRRHHPRHHRGIFQRAG
jgi:hypothetical protein